MSLLVPVYRPGQAPDGALVEHPGHFDAPRVPPGPDHVLRAETGSEPRSLRSPLLKGLQVLSGQHRDGIPRLWVSQAWVREFYLHFHRLTRASGPPRLLVLTPPLFADCPDLETFLALYRPFEAELARRRPGVWLHLENRAASSGPGLFSRAQDLGDLARAADGHTLTLRLCLNLPRLFFAHLGGQKPTARDIEDILTPLRRCAHVVGALRPFADPDAVLGSPELTGAVLTRLREILNDGRQRYLLPADGQNDASGLKALRLAGFRPAE